MLLLRGATPAPPLPRTRKAVSIHAPLARSNIGDDEACFFFVRFNTCSSCEEQRSPRSNERNHHGFNTCSSCEEQPAFLNGQHWELAKVSIHAPLARSNSDGLALYVPLSVSIHAPLARSNGSHNFFNELITVSIHAPLARSNLYASSKKSTIFVSIHAPLARSNWLVFKSSLHKCSFNTCSSCEEQPFIRQTTLRRVCFNTCSSCEEQRRDS